MPQQEYAADKPGEVNPLPAHAGQRAAVYRVLHNLLNGMSGAQGRFKRIQRRRLADTVNTDT
ncbi:Uncharacterised protein [Salmonella enterica subsp. enterica]|nr:Uncharacterised protein [Salmonella enterica subsp. enterica]